MKALQLYLQNPKSVYTNVSAVILSLENYLDYNMIMLIIKNLPFRSRLYLNLHSKPMKSLIPSKHLTLFLVKRVILTRRIYASSEIRIYMDNHHFFLTELDIQTVVNKALAYNPELVIPY
jgi:hypothetical protein